MFLQRQRVNQERNTGDTWKWTQKRGEGKERPGGWLGPSREGHLSRPRGVEGSRSNSSKTGSEWDTWPTWTSWEGTETVRNFSFRLVMRAKGTKKINPRKWVTPGEYKVVRDRKSSLVYRMDRLWVEFCRQNHVKPEYLSNKNGRMGNGKGAQCGGLGREES